MDVNKTAYSVTAEHGGNSHTVTLTSTPGDISGQPPTPPVLKQDVSNRYYSMTNFAEFVPMMNRALQQAWAITNPTQENAPFIDFDPDSCNSS